MYVYAGGRIGLPYLGRLAESPHNHSCWSVTQVTQRGSVGSTANCPAQVGNRSNLHSIEENLSAQKATHACMPVWCRCRCRLSTRRKKRKQTRFFLTSNYMYVYIYMDMDGARLGEIMKTPSCPPAPIPISVRPRLSPRVVCTGTSTRPRHPSQ